MPNIAAILKSDIARLARKQVRDETKELKKSIAHYRSDIAALKTRTHALEQQINASAKESRHGTAGSPGGQVQG